MTQIPADTILYRIHRLKHDPLFFGPAPAGPKEAASWRIPESRFDSATGRFGVLYIGSTLEAALVETLLRNPARRLVAASRIAGRASSEIAAVKSLTLVLLMDAGLQQLGLDNSISTGPYEPCGLWADALWDHPAKPDGLLYRSRHDPSQTCIALFERADDRVAPIAAPVALSKSQSTVARVLDRYGKGIEPGD